MFCFLDSKKIKGILIRKLIYTHNFETKRGSSQTFILCHRKLSLREDMILSELRVKHILIPKLGRQKVGSFRPGKHK